MSKIRELLKQNFLYKRIICFEGCSELLFRAYVGELVALLGSDGTFCLNHENVSSKETSHAAVLDKLINVSCFGVSLIAYDDPRLPLDSLTNIKNFLCLYSSSFQWNIKQDNIIVVKVDRYSLIDLVDYYAQKESLLLDDEGKRFIALCADKYCFSIEEEVKKLSLYFGNKKISLNELKEVISSDEKKIAELCRDFFFLNCDAFFAKINMFDADDAMLIMRTMQRYCTVALSVESEREQGRSLPQIAQYFKEKVFYDSAFIERVSSSVQIASIARSFLPYLLNMEREYKTHNTLRFSILKSKLYLFLGYLISASLSSVD